ARFRHSRGLCPCLPDTGAASGRRLPLQYADLLCLSGLPWSGHALSVRAELAVLQHGCADTRTASVGTAGFLRAGTDELFLVSGFGRFGGVVHRDDPR